MHHHENVACQKIWLPGIYTSYTELTLIFNINLIPDNYSSQQVIFTVFFSAEWKKLHNNKRLLYLAILFIKLILDKTWNCDMEIFNFGHTSQTLLIMSKEKKKDCRYSAYLRLLA